MARMPFGKQFSPNQVSLPGLLRIAAAHKGDRDGFLAAVKAQYWTTSGTADTMAYNTFLAMRDYGLIEDSAGEFDLSEIGKQLLSRIDDRAAMYRFFARHILTELHGIQLVEVCRSRLARGEPLTAAGIAADLRALDIDPGGERGEKLNPMRLYLEKAGIFKNRWEVDDDALETVLGIRSATLEALADLPLTHRAFLRAMATMSGPSPYNSQQVVQLARQQTPEATFDLKQVPKVVLKPLEEAGWLTVTKTTGGRGAKAHLVTPTATFEAVISVPLANALAEQAHLADPADLRRPFAELLDEVRDSTLSSYQRGRALEGVSIQVLRLMGARFLFWRRRASDTAGAEVDVVGELANGRYLVVQIQSKASAITTRDVVDREVGVATTLRSNVVLFISAKRVGSSARNAADNYMRNTNLSIVFIDGEDLDSVKSGAELAPILAREYRRVRSMRVPRDD